MAAKGKVKDMIKMLDADGWEFVCKKGSHRQFKHSKKKGRVTVAGDPNDPMPTGTWLNILKQAGLK